MKSNTPLTALIEAFRYYFKFLITFKILFSNQNYNTQFKHYLKIIFSLAGYILVYITRVGTQMLVLTPRKIEPCIVNIYLKIVGQALNAQSASHIICDLLKYMQF